jgi:MFS family permease
VERLRNLTRRQFDSLRYYNYRSYFLGQTVSLTGTWVQRTGQSWLVLQITGSAAALGTVTALQFLPITIFTLFGGVFADRWPKREVLIVTQVVSLVQAFVLGLLVLTGTVELWHVYALALLLGLANAFDGPVRQAFVVELVGKEQLVNAIALNSTNFNLARIIGPGVGGVAIATTGLAMTFFLNAASFVAVIAGYLLMRPSQFFVVDRKQKPGGNIFKQIGEGLRYGFRTPEVLFLFILLAAIGVFGFNFQVWIPLLAEFVLKVGPGQFGLLTSCMGVGSLVAALSLAALGKSSNRVLLISCGAFVVGLAAIAVSTNYWVTAGLLVAFGAASLVFSTTVNTALQVSTPDELRGRVMSIFFLLMAGSTPIGGAFTGYVSEHAGVRIMLIIEAAICGLGVLAAIGYLTWQRRRHGAAILVTAPQQ